MPFNFATYRAKCGGLTAEELQVEWQNYTRQLSTGATTTATSVLLSPITHGISLVGLAISVPQIHNARKKRAIIVNSMQQQGAEPHTRRRDIIFPSAISVATAALTLGFTPHFAVALGGEAGAKGIEYLISHVALDVIWTILGESNAIYLKKREKRKIKRDQHRHRNQQSLKYHATNMGEKKLSAGRNRTGRLSAHSDSDTSDDDDDDDARYEKEIMRDEKAHLFEFKPQAARGKTHRPGQQRGHNRRAGYPGPGINSYHSYSLPRASHRRKEVQRSPSQPPSHRSHHTNNFNDKSSQSAPELPPRRLSMIERAMNINQLRGSMAPERAFTKNSAFAKEAIDSDSDSDEEGEKELVSDSDEESSGCSSDEDSDEDSDEESDEESDEDSDKEIDRKSVRENRKNCKAKVDEKNMELVLTMEEEIALLKATILRMEMEKRGIVVEPNAGIDPTFVRQSYDKLKDGIPVIDQAKARDLESAGLKNAKDLSMKRRSPVIENISHNHTLNKMPSDSAPSLPRRHKESSQVDAKTTLSPVIAKPSPEYQIQVDECEKITLPRSPYKTRPVQTRRDSGYFSNYSSSSLVSIPGSMKHARRQSVTSPGSGSEAMKESSSRVLDSSKADSPSLNMDSSSMVRPKMAPPSVSTRQTLHRPDPPSTCDEKSMRNLEKSLPGLSAHKALFAPNPPSVSCEPSMEKHTEWQTRPVIFHHLPTPQVVVNAAARSWRAPA